MQLEELRKEIDKIDEKLLLLLEERLEKAKQITEYKKENNIPETQKEREEEILDKLTQLGKGKLRDEYIKNIFRQIIQESHKIKA